MNDSTKRRWRGIDPDQRQHDRRQRLLDAALDLVGTNGLTALSVRAVCAEAELTSRYFYESFTDLDALLAALYDDLTQAVIEQTGIAVLEAGGDLRTRLRAGLEAGARHFLEDPRRLRFLIVEATGSEPLNRRRRDLTRQVASALEGVGHDVFAIPASDHAFTAIAARFFIGGIVELLTAAVEGDLGDDLDHLITATTDIALNLADLTFTSTKRPSG